jgi:hypothetical protein
MRGFAVFAVIKVSIDMVVFLSRGSLPESSRTLSAAQSGLVIPRVLAQPPRHPGNRRIPRRAVIAE